MPSLHAARADLPKSGILATIIRAKAVARAVLITLLLASCSSDELLLAVGLRTDFAPVLEFAQVRVEVPSEDAVLWTQSTEVAAADDFLVGRRVVDFELPAGSYSLVATLLDSAGGEVARQRTLIDMTTDYAVTLLVNRNCSDVVCPPSTAPSLTSCVDGTCVDPRCSAETPEFCGGACSTDSECAADSACTRGVCIGSVCFVQPDPSLCESGVCDPGVGCIETPYQKLRPWSHPGKTPFAVLRY